MSDAQTSTRTETKEEKKARKATKKQAKAETKGTDGQSVEETNNVIETEQPLKKTKKRKAEDVEPEQTVGSMSGNDTITEKEIPSLGKKQKRSKKDKKSIETTSEDVIVEDPVGVTAPEENKIMESGLATTEEPVQPEPKKSKRSKKRKPVEPKEETEGTEKVEATEGEVIEQKEPTQPVEDSSINEQAQKGLNYAWLHKLKQSDESVEWKFNKAKQNWLLRNYWQRENVPERWIDLTIGYLKTIQGVGQKNLIEEARKRLNPPQADEPASTEVEQDEDKAVAKPTEDQNTNESEQAETVTEGEAVIEEVKPVEETEEEKSIKDRATRLLVALGQDT